MHQRPNHPLDAEGRSRLTVFGAPWCEDTAITRSRLAALNVPFLYVDLEADPAADAYVRGLHGGSRITPTVVLGAEEEVAAEPDLATVDRLAGLAWPGLAIERPTLSPPVIAWAADELPVGPPGGLAASADAAGLPAVDPAGWATGPAGHLAITMLAHGGGCLPCLGYAKRLLAQRGPSADADAAGVVVVVVVVADEPDVVTRWRRDLPATARILADPGSRWGGRMLERLLTAPGAPEPAVRDAHRGVALMVIDARGTVLRMAAGPEAGYLPDPVTVADAIVLDHARDGLPLDA